MINDPTDKSVHASHICTRLALVHNPFCQTAMVAIPTRTIMVAGGNNDLQDLTESTAYEIFKQKMIIPVNNMTPPGRPLNAPLWTGVVDVKNAIFDLSTGVDSF
jgi:hypothetical protein